MLEEFHIELWKKTFQSISVGWSLYFQINNIQGIGGLPKCYKPFNNIGSSNFLVESEAFHYLL